MTNKRKQEEVEQERQDLIDKWKRQFEVDRNSKSTIDTADNANEELYQGKRYFGNLKDEGYNHAREVRTVVNFVRMAIEALIDLSVPEADLRAVALDDETAVRELKHYITYVSRAANLEEINLENERRVKKFGGAFYKVHWNNAVKNGSYVGDIELSNPLPKHIVPNAGAINWDDDLEHYHHILNKTEKYVLRRFPHLTKDDLEDKATLYKEYDELDNNSDGYISSGDTNDRETGLKRYSIIETTYRDDEGDICKIWWSGDLLIDHIEKFYWHRDEEGNPTETEILEPGTQIRIGTDEQGQPIFRTVEQQTDEAGEPLFDEQGFPVGEEVEYYIPKGFDIIYQPYLPKDLSCWGTSMIDDIKDLYEAILKGVFIQEESFLRGRKKIVTDNDEDKQQIESATSSVIKVTGQWREMDMGAIDALPWVEKLKEWMQLLTGATNAAMGVHDPGVKSGRQVQLYVSQANFKAALASTYKAIAFKKLYKLIADFAMAFCDDDRPFRLSGDKNKPEYGSFSRLSLLRDDSGNVIYPNWDIEVGAQAGWLQNKSEILEQIVMLANNRAFDPTPGNMAYLKILQKLGVPFVEGALQDIEREIEDQKRMAEEQIRAQQAQANNPDAIIAQLPPDQQEAFRQLRATNPEQAQAMLAEVMGQAQGQGGGQNG
jgi:hypothetical protein